ncbi:hypothetical protein [Rhizosaccharibacter radicis]|uniref:Uncharacterized protein n=1 Tax=Rhizosaccharibacter radicis TaxID=2782605 RepID=A0ABT1W228_9PROT|nr:hypothetical protein [Acetobacteraceae bacterium KSS12]
MSPQPTSACSEKRRRSLEGGATREGHGRPVVMLPTAGQRTDPHDAVLRLAVRLSICGLLTERSYDSSWFRIGLAARAIAR